MPAKAADANAPVGARRDSMEAEASGQLTQLTLFGLLAFIAWFVAVEQPKVDQIDGLQKSVQLLQKQTYALQDQLASTNKELDRVEQESPAGRQSVSMKVFQREYEDRIAAVRVIVEDVQRQVGVERKQREEHRETDRDIVGQLSQHLKWLDKQVHNLRGEVDSANRLEKANAVLEGRLPRDFGTESTEGEAQDLIGDRAGGAAKPSGTGTKGSQPDSQPATGGLVELRHGDFSKLLQEGDSWVVMFYAPWCSHCTAAAPAFQQAALQAPVHFARLDAAAHPEVAQSEEVTGFPTIRFYSKGKVVRCVQSALFLSMRTT